MFNHTISTPYKFTGPAPNPLHSLPSLPKFSWDERNAPWNHGKGDQEDYFHAVGRRNSFHAALPDENSSKISEHLRAICLQSQLYGRARDLCYAITDNDLIQPNAINTIVACVYHRVAHSMVSEAIRHFNNLLICKTYYTETMKSFEGRSNAVATKFNSISQTTKLLECTTSLLLLANAQVSDTQCVTVLAAGAPNDQEIGASAPNDRFFQAVSYNAVSSVVKQGDTLT